jgi:SAM-dependent methyltransferase
MSERRQRLVFGEDAEQYEAARPGYPTPLIEDVAWAEPQRRALEVGSGTGKVTRELAAHGVSVVAVEPDAAMSAVARRSIDGPGEVEFIAADFERADLGGRRFPLVCAGQSWHWIDQQTGFETARAALQDGGHLVVFWNRPLWTDPAVVGMLRGAYEDALPERPPVGVFHPTLDIVSDNRAYWPAAIGECAEFGDPEVRDYDWSETFTAQRYAQVLSTISDVRMLPAEDRERFLQATMDAIDEYGGGFELQMTTLTGIATAV